MMHADPTDKSRPGRIIMVATIFLICLVLLLNQVATRSLPSPSQKNQGSGSTDSLEERFGAGLFWQIDMAVSEWNFEVSLKDEGGYPVKEGTVRLVIFGRGEEKALEQRLEEKEPGLFIGPLPVLKQGRFEARIEAVSPQGRVMKVFMIQF